MSKLRTNIMGAFGDLAAQLKRYEGEEPGRAGPVSIIRADVGQLAEMFGEVINQPAGETAAGDESYGSAS